MAEVVVTEPVKLKLKREVVKLKGDDMFSEVSGTGYSTTASYMTVCTDQAFGTYQAPFPDKDKG